ncbi:MAG: bacterial Ig-like domain-containing protein [Oscillospiraceae bacterium]|nr:bacterial Ig-like domain-containing protein [Oscillospiraceae bacterium]
MKRKFAVLTAAIVWLSITAFTSVSSQKFYTFPKNDASALSIIANIKEVSLENDSIKIGETTHLKASFDTGITYNAQCYSSDSSIVKVLSGSANDGWEIEGIASGTAKIIVSNGGIYEKSIDITVEDVSLPTETTTEQIVLVEPGCYINTVSKPVKSVYQVGEALDLTGLKVDVMFAPGGEMPISQIDNDWRKVIDAANPLENDYFVVDTSEFDSSKTGTYNVKISLTDEACKKWWYCYPAKISVTVLDEIVKGDVNADEKFDISDVVLLQKWLLGVSDVTLPNWKAADFCEDGKLNVLDLCMMKCKLIENSYNKDEDVFSPCETTIDEEFLAYGVVVTMKKQYKTNPLRIWTKDDFKNVQNINFISDATTQSSERQILYITLIEQSKENVLKLIKEIENLNIPDIYTVRTMNFDSSSEVPV